MTDHEDQDEHESHMQEFYEEHSRMANFQRDDTLVAALRRQWGSAPWYLSSFLIHIVIFGVIILFTPEPKPPQPPAVNIVGAITEPIDEKIEDTPEMEVQKDTNIEPQNVETKIDTDITISTDITIDTQIDVGENDNGNSTDGTDFAGVGDANMTMGAIATIAAGGSGKSKGKFANRTGSNKSKILRQNKVSKASQIALTKGLTWLSKTQETDGSWRCSKHEGGNYDISVTAMAQLAFLGSGSSSKFGPYRKNVRAAEKFLLSKHNEKTGRIGNYRYEAAITMMAMAESWAMSEDKRLKPIVEGQVADAVKYQSTNGGWGYKTDLDPVKAHVDTSVAGWWVMGLKSSKVAGVKIPEKTWNKAKDYFRSVTKAGKNGIITSGYTSPGGSGNLTAVGLTCLQFLGLSREDQLVKGQADYFLTPGKMISKNYQAGNPYYGWYYQALGLFQMGTKSKYWKEFSKNMQTVMVDLQINNGKNKGAWPVTPPSIKKAGLFGGNIGLVGTTAISCLILEVFYRYEELRH